VEHAIADLMNALPAERREMLGRYETLLRERAVPKGFVARADASRLRERHVLDSLRVMRCLHPADREIADVGSGAGLPGIPIAIASPDRHVTLIEAAAGRAAFLELVAGELGLVNVDVVVARAQEIHELVEVCVARAVADARGSWTLASRLLAPSGRLLYFAGASWAAETRDALRSAGVSASICDESRFPGYGPVVIMRAMPDDPMARSASR
jgi:16S rRNA (guanine527-N7)-methyltransferase